MFKTCSFAALAPHSVHHSNTTTSYGHPRSRSGYGRQAQAYRATLPLRAGNKPDCSTQNSFLQAEWSVVCPRKDVASRESPGFISTPRVAIIGPRGKPRRVRRRVNVQLGNNSPCGSHEPTKTQTPTWSETALQRSHRAPQPFISHPIQGRTSLPRTLT